jgi:hypothetical protein
MSNSGEYDYGCLAACLGDVAINFSLKSIPVVGTVMGLATEYFGTELHLAQWAFGYDEDVYSSGFLDYASAAGNQARDLSRLEYNSRGGDVGLKRAQRITGRTGKTSANLKLKEASKLKYINAFKPFAKSIPVLSQLLNIADALSDVSDCFDKCKR